jgi:hypothetical protein
MRIRIPDKYRLALGRKYLDWAEKLPPKFNIGVIPTLQRIRERQRRGSEKAHSQSRPPQGTELEYLSFRLIEMFHIEDLQQLVEGTLHLFPELDDNVRHKTFSADFKRQARSIWGRSWWNLGHIVRERKGRIFGRPLREMSKLPPEVDHIQVGLHQILPSMFIVTFDVYLTDSATQRLVQLQSMHYLPEVRFPRLIPRGILAGGYSLTSAEAVMRKEILSWLKQLRGEVEVCLKPFVNGYFMRYSSDKVARLPAVEVYALKGVLKENGAGHISNKSGEEPKLRTLHRFLVRPWSVFGWKATEQMPQQSIIQAFQDSCAPNETLNTWINEAWQWWRSLGFNSFGYNLYTDGKLMFPLHQDEVVYGRSERIPHRLIVLWEPYLASIETDGFSEDKKAAVADYTQDTLDTMLPSIAVLSLLILFQRNIETLRQKTFRSMETRWPPNIGLIADIRRSDTIMQASMLLDRISKEFQQEQASFRHDLRKIAALRSIGDSGTKYAKELGDVLLESISFRIELLNKHLFFVQDWFSQYLTLRNTAVTYFLAIIAGSTAIISVILAIATLWER